MADSFKASDVADADSMPSASCNCDVFLFPGQGSQRPGMGGDLSATMTAKEVFACASDVFGFDVAQVSLEGPEDLLNETYHAQAAILALSISLSSMIAEAGIKPAAVLGFSLGQIAALPAAGMLTVEQCFELARFRAECMADAAKEHAGAMCALLGADEASVQALCEECANGDVLVPANYNAPGQIVISGDVAAIDRAQEAWAAEKKRCVKLATSGAFHSPLMADAAQAFASYLSSVDFNEPTVPLICNTDASPLDAKSAPERLSAHLVQPVRFEQSIANLIEGGATRFVEIGFGGVLTGLAKRIDRSTVRIKVEDTSSLEGYINEKLNTEEADPA